VISGSSSTAKILLLALLFPFWLVNEFLVYNTYNKKTLLFVDDESTTILTQDIQVCRSCGVVFDLNTRQNKDCPACGAGERTKLRVNNSSDSNQSSVDAY
jgi:hypothetical protein